MNDQVTIFLTTPEAQMWASFQQFHKTFALLCEKGVFDIKGGSATIHFDPSGFIQKIERHDNLYDRRIEKLCTS